MIDWTQPIELDTVPPRPARVMRGPDNVGDYKVWADWHDEGEACSDWCGPDGTPIWEGLPRVRNVIAQPTQPTEAKPRDALKPSEQFAADFGPLLDALPAAMVTPLRRVTDDLYSVILEETERYICSNVEWNIGNRLDELNRVSAENRRLETEAAARDALIAELVGACAPALHELDVVIRLLVCDRTRADMQVVADNLRVALAKAGAA